MLTCLNPDVEEVNRDYGTVEKSGIKRGMKEGEKRGSKGLGTEGKKESEASKKRKRN